MAEKYFKKELARNKVRTSSGDVIQFEILPGDTGVIKLDDAADAALIAELGAMADKRISGVVRISAEIYESLKKNEFSNPSPRSSSILRQLNQVRVQPRQDDPYRSKAVESVAAASGEKPLIVYPNKLPTEAEVGAANSVSSFRDKVRKQNASKIVVVSSASTQ